MHIEVLYKDHRYESFEPTTQTAPEPYRSRGTNVLTDFNLCLGEVETQGVILVAHYYALDTQAEDVMIFGNMMPQAIRRLGHAMLLVSPDELSDLIWLKKDGEKLLWREGDDLINGERFFAMEQLCYSDAVTKSINRRALAVFDYLKHAERGLSDAEIAKRMGYTEAAILRIRDAEFSQDDGFIADMDNNGEVTEDPS